MTNHTLPQVIEFNHAYDVKLEHRDGHTRVIARIKLSKNDRGYKYFHDLPFVHFDAVQERFHWFYVRPAASYTEQNERGDYFWHEYVRFVRGPQKRRRADALSYTRILIDALGRYDDCRQESKRFTEHLAEALVAHLRIGLDDGKAGAA